MGVHRIAVKDEEIENLLADVNEQWAKGGSKYPGMSYEEGILAAIDWITGNTDENPYSDE